MVTFEQVVLNLMQPSASFDIHQRLDDVIWLQSYLQWPNKDQDFHRCFANAMYWSRISTLPIGIKEYNLDRDKINLNLFRNIEPHHIYYYLESEKAPNIRFRFYQRFDEMALTADFVRYVCFRNYINKNDITTVDGFREFIRNGFDNKRSTKISRKSIVDCLQYYYKSFELCFLDEYFLDRRLRRAPRSTRYLRDTYYLAMNTDFSKIFGHAVWLQNILKQRLHPNFKQTALFRAWPAGIQQVAISQDADLKPGRVDRHDYLDKKR